MPNTLGFVNGPPTIDPPEAVSVWMGKTSSLRERYGQGIIPEPEIGPYQKTLME